MTLARDLARLVARTAVQDIPPVAIERAQMVLASTMASAAVGAEIESARIITSLAQEAGGTPEASVWFHSGPRLPVASAARANAVMSDAAASDDSDLRNIAHIGTIVTAVSLAAAERTGASYQDLLSAMVLGFEVAGRIGERITPGFSDRGFHGCVITIFGGAAAAGRLLGLTESQLAQAIAIAATSIGGLYAAANTSVAREYHAGQSALLSVNAALAAGHGFEVDEAILETGRGFFETFGGTDLDRLTTGLGSEWDIVTDMAIKLAPGAHPYHASAEAAIHAANEAGCGPDEIQGITVAARQLGRSLVYHPTDLVGMAHSLPYFVAAGVVDRDFSWVHASPEKIADPAIGRLQDRISMDPLAEHHTRVARWCGGMVSITTATGKTFTCTVEAPRGSGPRGIEWADVDAKFRALAPARLSRERIERCLDLVHNSGRVGMVPELIKQLTE